MTLAPLFRRKYPRMQISLRSSILVEGKAYLTDTHELGESGMSFLFKQELAPEKGVAVILFFSQASEILNVLASVKSCEVMTDGYWRIGLQFETLTFNSSTKLRRFITGRESF